jgi:hypothetical protein
MSVTAWTVQLSGNILGQLPSSLYCGAVCARTAGLTTSTRAKQQPMAIANDEVHTLSARIECSCLRQAAPRFQGNEYYFALKI